MSRPLALFTHLATLLVGGSGLAFAWMLYLAGPPEDEFALVNHPWQPEAHALHVVAAPLLVFACGCLWPLHVVGRLRSGDPSRRRTGLALAGLAAPMVLSGYLLQVSVEETWRRGWVVLHVGTSLGWLVLYLVHLVLRRSERADL